MPRIATAGADSPGAPLAASQAQPPAPAKLRGRVLVAEDNESNQIVARAQLERMGLEVLTAGDGQQALDRLANETVDLVLMDCQMPVLDGYAATAALRQREAGSERHLPVIALTASAMQGDAERCRAAGMDDYLAKPYSAEALYPVLARWLPAERRQPGMASAGPRGGEGAGTRRQPPAAAAIDPAAFDKIRALSPAGGDDLLPQVVTAYLQAAEREFGRLEQGLAVADPSLLGKAAHALKSGSYNVGALQFAACCQAVESAAREGRNGELPALVDELRLAWGPVDAELKDLLKALRP